MTRQTDSWLLVGHFGGHNTGDDAMLSGLVQGCSPALRRRLLVVSKGGALPPPVALAGVTAISPQTRPVLRALWNSHGLALGGGSHFHDDYAPARLLRHVRYMARFVVLTLLARLLGKRVVWLGQGIGPLDYPPTRLLTAVGARLCRHISVRERASYQELTQWVPTARLTHAFDLAALLAEDEPRVQPTSSPLLLGMSVLSVQHTRTGGPQAEQLFWPRLQAALVQVFTQQTGLRVRLFVIRGGQREDDFAATVRLYRALTAIDPARVEIVPYLDDPRLTLHKLRECGAFIATRFHAGVLAYLAGCRLLLLAYHRKLSDLAHEIGLAAQACVPVAPDITETLLVERIEGLLSQDAGYQPTLPVSTATARARRSIALLER
jgi:polysaccharide pyruvyl transferase WcaK-like protein